MFNHPNVSIDAPGNMEEHDTLGEFILSMKTAPFDYAIAKDLLDSVSELRRTILEDPSAGYIM